MQTEYLAVRRQIEADVRTAWGFDRNVPVHVSPMELVADKAPYAIIRRAAPVSLVNETPLTDELTLTFEVIGRFAIIKLEKIDDEQVRLASLLRKQLYASHPYAGVAFLEQVTSMLDEAGQVGDQYFEVALTFECRLSAARSEG